MMVSISTEYYQFLLAQGVCSPIGASAIFFAATASVSTWFKGRRAFALGIVFSGSSLGGVFFPIIVNKLVVRVGFAWTMRICAFLILLLMVIANLTIKSRLRHQPKRFHVGQFIQPLKETPFVVVLISSFLFFLGVFLPFNYIVQMAIRNGMSASLANYLVSIISALR
jgi:MFS family permease